MRCPERRFGPTLKPGAGIDVLKADSAALTSQRGNQVRSREMERSQAQRAKQSGDKAQPRGDAQAKQGSAGNRPAGGGGGGGAPPQLFEQPQVMCDSFGPLIESFFDRITTDQWRLLKAGNPDQTTASVLAELLMNIVASLSDGFLAVLQNLNVTMSAEDVQASLGDTLSQSFAEALGFDDLRVSLEASEHLKSLVVKEVSETVSSILSAADGEESSARQRLTPPRRLKAMLRDTLAMLRILMRNIFIPRLVPLPQQAQAQNQAQAQAQNQAQAQAQNQSQADKRLQSEEHPATAKAAWDIIKKEADALVKPLMEKATEGESKLLQALVAAELEKVAEDVAKLMAESKSSERDVNVKTKPRRKPAAAKAVAPKIKAFLARSRAKAWILCMVAQRRKKSQLSAEQSRQLLQSLLHAVDCLLEDAEAQTSGEPACAFPRLKAVSQGQDPPLAAHLGDTVDYYVSGKRIPEIVRKMTPWRTTAIPAASLHPLSLLKVFLSVMSWWLETQADAHVERVAAQLTAADA